MCLSRRLIVLGNKSRRVLPVSRTCSAFVLIVTLA